MLVNVILTQTNKKETVTFKAFKKFNVGNEPLEAISKEISNFAYDVKELCERNEKRGYNSNVKIRKSQPLQLTLVTDEDETVKLELKNFGKFLELTTRKKLDAFLSDNIQFVYKWSATDLTDEEIKTLKIA